MSASLRLSYSTPWTIIGVPLNMTTSQQPSPTVPGVDESFYRFYPPTKYTEGRRIEELNTQVARLCSTPLSRGDKNENSNCSKKRPNVKESVDREDDHTGLVPPVVAAEYQADGDSASGVEFDATSQGPEEEHKPPQLLFLARHGQTDMNAAGRLQGRGVNAQLNEAGRLQADELGRFLRMVPFGAVMSSSLDRAHETAGRIAAQNIHYRGTVTGGSSLVTSSEKEETKGREILSGVTETLMEPHVDLTVLQNEGVDELSWGILEGQDAAQEPWKTKLAALKWAWDDGQFDLAAEKGENLLQVEARAREALEDLLDEGHELNLVASHGRTLRILMLSLAGISLKEMTRMGKIPNVGLYIVEARRTRPGSARSYRLLTPSPQ